MSISLGMLENRPEAGPRASWLVDALASEESGGVPEEEDMENEGKRTKESAQCGGRERKVDYLSIISGCSLKSAPRPVDPVRNFN